MISETVLKAQFDTLVQLAIEKINISESIKLIKENLKDEGMEKAEIAALVKIASAKAKEAVEDLAEANSTLQEMLTKVS